MAGAGSRGRCRDVVVRRCRRDAVAGGVGDSIRRGVRERLFAGRSGARSRVVVRGRREADRRVPAHIDRVPAVPRARASLVRRPNRAVRACRRTSPARGVCATSAACHLELGWGRRGARGPRVAGPPANCGASHGAWNVPAGVLQRRYPCTSWNRSMRWLDPTAFHPVLWALSAGGVLTISACTRWPRSSRAGRAWRRIMPCS